jgi:hypothetical protein
MSWTFDDYKVTTDYTDQGHIPIAWIDEFACLSAQLVSDFWEHILGTSYATSFVSNQSQLSTWEHYCRGGKEEVIQRVKERYGVDISALYDEPIPAVLKHIAENSPRKRPHSIRNLLRWFFRRDR